MSGKVTLKSGGCEEKKTDTQARNKEPEASRERRRKGGPERRERWAELILKDDMTTIVKSSHLPCEGSGMPAAVLQR